MVLLLSAAISVFVQSTWQKEQKELLFQDPPFAQCHASTILEISPGKLMVAWFAGTYERYPDVGIWLIVQEKGKWSMPTLLAEGIINDTLRCPCWNPVLFKAKAGKLFLFYEVGPSPSDWWGMVLTSTNNGKSWTPPVRLPDGTLGPIKNKPIQLADGSILSPSSTETGEKWRVHLEKSTDLGETWQRIPVDLASNLEVIQPSISVYPNKQLQLLCRSKHNR